MNDDLDPWMTVGEAAVKMRVSKMTVYRMVHDGTLPSTRVTQRSIRVRQSVVEGHIAATSQGKSA